MFLAFFRFVLSFLFSFMTLYILKEDNMVYISTVIGAMSFLFQYFNKQVLDFLESKYFLIYVVKSFLVEVVFLGVVVLLTPIIIDNFLEACLLATAFYFPLEIINLEMRKADGNQRKANIRTFLFTNLLNCVSLVILCI